MPLAPQQAQPPSQDLFVETFSAGLQSRTLGGLMNVPSPAWWLIYVENGTVQALQDDQVIPLIGPLLAWIPRPDLGRLRADAGTVGGGVLLGESTLANAIGHKPESADLRLMVRSPGHLNLTENVRAESDIKRAFATMHHEFTQAAPGAGTVIEAQIRVLLVTLWRHVALAGEEIVHRASAAQALQTFRQLVESHFRDRWGVEDYAQTLGMTRDRLHDICIRTLDKPPSQLLRERTAAEAEALLWRSTQTIEQISDHLGFHAPSHFSRFFYNVTGRRPGALRKEAMKQRSNLNHQGPQSFADWP